MSTQHVMIDIETLAGPTPENHVEERAKILQIGAQVFDVDGVSHEAYEWTIDSEDSLNNSRVIDPDTSEWWGKPAQRDSLVMIQSLQRTQPVSLEQALEELFQACLNPSGSPKYRKVWANSPDFDLAILGNAYIEAGMGSPFYYQNRRDYRTLKTIFGKGCPADSRGGHTALADATAQAEHLIKMSRHYGWEIK